MNLDISNFRILFRSHRTGTFELTVTSAALRCSLARFGRADPCAAGVMLPSEAEVTSSNLVGCARLKALLGRIHHDASTAGLLLRCRGHLDAIVGETHDRARNKRLDSLRDVLLNSLRDTARVNLRL